MSGSAAMSFSLLSISGSLRRFTYSVSANRYPTVVSNTFARFLATSIEGFISLRSYLEIPETEVCSFN